MGWRLELSDPVPSSLYPCFLQVSLRDCHNVSVFLAPSVVGLGSTAGKSGSQSWLLSGLEWDGPSWDGPAFSDLPLCPPPSWSFLQLPLLEDKLQDELPAGARVVSGRFPLPTWQPVAVVGEGMDRVWAYDVHGTGPVVSSCGVPIKATPESSSTSIPRAPV